MNVYTKQRMLFMCECCGYLLWHSIYIVFRYDYTAKFFFLPKMNLSPICNTHVWHDRIDEEQTPMFNPSK